MTQTMPALTIWQPWASLIMAGAKPIEWRGWPAPLRLVGQRIAIHAGSRPVRPTELTEMILDLRKNGETGTSLLPEIAIPLLERWHTAPGMLPLSSVICTAILGQPIPADRYAKSRGIDSNRIDHSKFGWPLTDVQPVTPMSPARGYQSFWQWTVTPNQ